MRAPSPLGTPIDGARYAGWMTSFAGYRVAVTQQVIEDWLDQFRPEDRDLAARVLDAVTFLRQQDIEDAYRFAFNQLPGWNILPASRAGRWRILPFSDSAGTSGDSMLHAARTALGMSGRAYNELFIHRSDTYRAGLGRGDNLVFVDDFTGTGDQLCNAWQTGLSELVPDGVVAYFVVAVCGPMAMRRISTETQLNVIAKSALTQSDDIFATACTHFSVADKARILSYCRKAKKRQPMGYGNCGFLIVFCHKAPNNTIPILHASSRSWTPIFPRVS
jgi:hypothetical protein